MIAVPDFADAPWRSGPGIAFLRGADAWDNLELSTRLARRVDTLRAQGLGANQAVLAPDSPGMDLLLMQLALARIGAALFPYRTGTAETEWRTLAGMTGAEWRWQPDSERLLPTGCGTARSIDAADSVALLIKTSGSSGLPKVAMLTADNLLASALAVNARLGLAPGDLWLTCLRLSHVGGISIGYRCALAGATLLLHEGFAAPAVMADLRARPVTHLSLVPPMLARLLDLDPTPPPHLRVLLVGGQATSRSLVQRALDAGWPLHLTYGMTETATQIATTGRLTGTAPESGLVGRLLPGIQVAAPDCASPPARLRIRGAMVMAGYANPRRDPGQGLEDGWFETADLACLADDGQLKVLGRADDLRVIGGNNVSLARVEAVLHEAAGVGEVVVVGLDDDIWGHRLVALYRGEIDESSLERWCGERLLGPERPREFRRLERLPLLPSGKYDRLQLESIARQGLI